MALRFYPGNQLGVCTNDTAPTSMERARSSRRGYRSPEVL